MKLNRRQLRRLIESVINEEESGERNLYVTVKGADLGDIGAKILEASELDYIASDNPYYAVVRKALRADKTALYGNTIDTLERSDPGNEMNHSVLTVLYAIGRGSNPSREVSQRLFMTTASYLIDKGAIITDHESKGNTVTYHHKSQLVDGHDIKGSQAAIAKGLKALGLNASVEVAFKG
jgi:hypothetical protein